MGNPRASVFYIDEWHVSPAEGILTRGGECTRLEPKTMDVLVYLAARPNEVITREELEADVWQGALVGYDAVTNTIIKLRKALKDNARQPHIIATIPKKGYQLIAPINYPDEANTPPLLAAQSASRKASEQAHRAKTFAWPGLKISLALLSILILIGGILLWPTTSPDTPTAGSKNRTTLPSIVVLPFQSLNPDPKQVYLADGMTDDIITDLTRLSNILVISGNTSSTYKNKHLPSKTIATELNVNYILKGSVRLVDDKIRINTQLYNAQTGFNVWAQRYERKVNELFSVQDDVTRNIVRSLTIKMTTQEQSRLAQRATGNLKAYDLFQEGQRIAQPRTQQALQQARESYKKAIELDPGYGRAYGAMAVTLSFQYVNGWTNTPVETLDRALVLAEKAVALDNSTPQTYWALSFAHLVRREYDQAEKVATRAITIAPNYADGYGLLALIKMYQGQPKQALALNNKGMRLNPYYSWQYLYTQGSAYYMQGNYLKSAAVLEQAQQRNESAVQVKLILAATYMHLHRQNDAEWLIEELRAISPTTTLADTKNNFPIADPHIKQVLLNDLRRAGLPD